MAKRKKIQSLPSKLTNTPRTLKRRLRKETPLPGKPGAIIDVVVELVRKLKPFDRVSVGVPGVVIGGIVKEAPNLGAEWQDYNIRDSLQERLKSPF